MKKLSLILVLGGFLGVFLVNSALAATEPNKCSPGSLIGVRYGQKGQAVINLQNCLAEGGFFSKGMATGFFGSLTRDAVKQFYRSALGIDFSDSLGPKGIARLRQMLSSITSPIDSADKEGIAAFSGTQDFKAYMEKANALRSSGSGGAILRKSMTSDLLQAPMVTSEMSVAGSPSQASGVADRVSGTNVQVAGIDEPDILKTDGQNIYYSPEVNYYSIMPMLGLSVERPAVAVEDVGPSIAPMPPRYRQPITVTRVIQALPPTALAEIGKIDQSGDLLLVKDAKMLLVLNHQGVFGYDLTSSASPQKKWELKYENSAGLVEARLAGGQLYLVTRNYIREGGPCLFEPMSRAGQILPIPCGQIYRPTRVIPADTGFSVLKVNPQNGEVINRLGFLGSSDSSVVYMSDSSLYITYFYTEGAFKVLFQGMTQWAKDLLPSDILERGSRLASYDLTDSSKLSEFRTAIEKYLQTLSADERMRIENEVEQRARKYYSEHKREFERTGIVKMDPQNLSIQANTSVPGYPLNQFALDEQNGYLRIATTVGERGAWGSGFGSQRDSANDLYVLDGSLNITGSVLGLGLTERIYSVRFVGDLAYLVTFRQIDPFYVLDLSNPQSPRLRGELKIPGYSAYLEPLPNKRVLGVGAENGQVKISLFDVSSPDNPRELDKYILKDYHTEILSNHRAFLRDEKHGVVFIPGGEGGYIFRYTADKLEMVKAISGYAVKRAAYLNDYLYILSADKITVLNENDWSTVKELTLKQIDQAAN